MINIYQHFRDDEQSFIDQVIDWIAQVENLYSPYLTHFLNPREIFIVQSIVGQYDDIEYKKFGGIKDAEQERILIFPPYFEPTIEDFEVVMFEINYPTKFAELSHGQIMGTVLGTGISRGNLGDIVTDGKRWQFFVDQKMADYVKMNVDKIGRLNVILEEKPLEEAIESIDKWEAEEIVVSSLRIDVVLARALNFSRSRAKTLIDEKKIKVNWAEIDRPDLEVEEHDIISIRGYGRLQIRRQLGMTRKDNLVLEIGRISRNS